LVFLSGVALFFLPLQLRTEDVELYASSGVLTFDLNIPSFELVDSETGETRIVMDGASYGFDPGYPMLPTLSYTFALPPGTRVEKAEVAGSREIIEGNYVIEPQPAPLPVGYSSNTYFQDLYEKNKQEIYSASDIVPNIAGELVSFSGRREYSLATVAVYPFSYCPQTGELYGLSGATIKISYCPLREDEFHLVEEFWAQGSLNSDVPESICNKDQAREWYAPSTRVRSSPRMLILTLDALQSSTENYISWREGFGYEVETVTLEDILSSGVEGLDTPEKIRNWLRSHAAPYDYLFIIGNYNDIPMRVLHGRGEDASADPSWYYPAVSDIYYGDLSSADAFSWDLDRDGLYGEVVSDGTGLILDMPDLEMELYVGRINLSDTKEIENILEKVQLFESSNDPTYKTSAVVHGSIPFYRTASGEGLDGAIFMEYLQETGILNRALTTSLYEKGGDLPSEFECSMPANHDNLVSSLHDNDVGVFVEYNHGSPVHFARAIIHDYNQDGYANDDEYEWFTELEVSDAWKLNLDHPNVAFLMSCLNGRPEEALCLAQALLNNGSVASVAHTRVSYSGGWHTPENGGFECLFYEDIKAFVQDSMSLGEAVSNSRPVLAAKEPGSHYLNTYTHLLYGDPSFKLFRYSSTDVAEPLPRVESIALSFGFPNSIRFSLPEPGYTRVEMWDVSGRRVGTLVDGWIEQGERTVSWNGIDLASGIYFITLRVSESTLSTKAVVIN
jgi:hypothetical protein